MDPALPFHPFLYPLFFSEFPWEETKLTSYLVTDRLGLLVREKESERGIVGEEGKTQREKNSKHRADLNDSLPKKEHSVIIYSVMY